ncbi:MAG: N-acetyl-gamma-glutamyl-phosphate reductase [Myxococcota bacterium]
MTLRVGIVGATGYVGSEIARWVLGHPRLELVAPCSTTQVGVPLAQAVPALLGCTDLVLEPPDPARLDKLDVVFLATPHGAAKPLAAQLFAPVLVDASADHRLHPSWVHGPPELLGDRIRGARRLAAPGCFATAVMLGVGPLVRAGAVSGPVCVAAATGSTGSGASPTATTHHPERFANLRAYAVGTHRHVPEIAAVLGALGDAPPVHLVPQSAPVDRGIFATCFVPVADVDPVAIVRDAYARAPLVRLREGSPELRHVRGTAFADLAVHHHDGIATVLVAIDNLGKGAAAQAVQLLNLALGLHEAVGLCLPAVTP